MKITLPIKLVTLKLNTEVEWKTNILGIWSTGLYVCMTYIVYGSEMLLRKFLRLMEVQFWTCCPHVINKHFLWLWNSVLRKTWCRLGICWMTVFIPVIGKLSQMVCFHWLRAKPDLSLVWTGVRSISNFLHIIDLGENVGKRLKTWILFDNGNAGTSKKTK